MTEANENPKNLRQGESHPYDLHFSGASAELIIGSVRFVLGTRNPVGKMVPVTIDGEELLGFRVVDDHLLLTLRVFDDNNQPVLRIRDNELVYSVSPWDIELEGSRLTVRAAAADFLLDVLFEPPSRLVVRRGRFFRNGIELLIKPRYVMVTNSRQLLADFSVEGCAVGIGVGRHANQHLPLFYFGEPTRNISLEHRQAAIQWADKRLTRIR